MSKKAQMKLAVPQGQLVFKVMSAQVLSFVSFLVQIAVFLISTKGSLFPGSDTAASIAGTCAEIIAGLYGITMASYTFFLSRIDSLTASDATLSYIVASIKKRFKYLVWFITGNVLVALFASITLMYFPMPTGENTSFLYRLFCNEFIVSFCYSVVLILYYSLLVIDPNALEKEAQKLKKRLSPQPGPQGSAVAFIDLYDRIEAVCNGLLPPSVLHQIRENKGNQFEYTISLLRESRPELRAVLMDVERIHCYYECAINCKALSVSQAMCRRAAQVLETLESHI